MFAELVGSPDLSRCQRDFRMISRIFQKIKQNPVTGDLLQQTHRRQTVLVKGLKGSYTAFLISLFNESARRPVLVIANDKEEAAYTYNDIQAVTGHSDVLFMPDSFKRPAYFDVLDPNNVSARTEVVNRISAEKATPPIIVTYPEALFEKVIAPHEVKKARLEIAKGSKLELDTVVDVLIEYEFKRVDFVYEPGEFAVRGGIVDIFSLGQPWPYRVELFDDEVESIRTFDPATQLSKEEQQIVFIVPDFTTLDEQTERRSLLDIIPDHCLIAIKDYGLLLDRLQSCFELAEEYAAALTVQSEEELKKILKERAFLYPREVLTQMDGHPIWLLGRQDHRLKHTHTVSFQLAPQPVFRKNFNLIIEDLQRHQAAGHEIFIFAESPRQFERFKAIFKDLQANIEFHGVPVALHEGFIARQEQVVCYTDHQIFERFHAYRLRKGFSKAKALNLRMIRDLVPGDYVTHIDYGIGRFSGLEKIDINGNVQEAVRIVYKNNDLLYVSIHSLHKLSKYVGKDGKEPTIHRIGSNAWQNLKRRTKRKIKDIAKELITLYAKRKASKGFAAQPDGYLQNELEASFIYEDTPDQIKVTAEVKKDMESEYPMDRLVCGDVGFGKTEIAVRAAFKAVLSGKQVAILVPTTILALQHYRTFSERLADFGVSLDYVNRFRSAKQKKEIFHRLQEGKLDILIGTHAILSKQVRFKDLGLLIIDEEQKFGVAAKEKLRKLKVNVDTLTMTATPIPRTLQFSLMAARDLSVIRTAPPNRQPIHTEVRTFDPRLIQDAIHYEVNRGGQVFFVHNRVSDLPDVAAMIRKLCPDVKVTAAHGKMDSKQLEAELMQFVRGETDVLVSTNIVETGLDIPNANTMIINNAQSFGLSDLHQLRGRVGRSNRKAFCYLIAPPLSALTKDARKRLRTIEEYSELGSGMDIAMRDLDIRGAGNILGGEQSGFIVDIGYDAYQKILDEAIEELKQNEFKDVFQQDKAEDGSRFVRDVQLDTDQELLFPSEYINSSQERLHLYGRLNELKDDEAITRFEAELRDRFGPVPAPVYALFDGLRVKWAARPLGFYRIVQKNRRLKCYFVNNPQSPFYETDLFGKLLNLLTQENLPYSLHLKKSNNNLILTVEQIPNLKKSLEVLEWLQQQCLTPGIPA